MNVKLSPATARRVEAYARTARIDPSAAADAAVAYGLAVMARPSEPTSLRALPAPLALVGLATVPAALVGADVATALEQLAPSNLPALRTTLELLGLVLGAGAVLGTVFGAAALARRFVWNRLARP